MNSGIITSFIIGGLLLLSMLQLNNQVLQNSAEITLEVTDKVKIESIRKIITHDFNRIGFGSKSEIKNFKPPHSIHFSAEMYGKDNAQIKWRFKKNNKVKKTPNPNDRILQRNGPISKGGGSKPYKFHIVDFSITGYSDTIGQNETTDKDKIKSLRIHIVYESPEAVSQGSGNKHYPKTVWQKLIVPNNLQLNN